MGIVRPIAAALLLAWTAAPARRAALGCPEPGAAKALTVFPAMLGDQPLFGGPGDLPYSVSHFNLGWFSPGKAKAAPTLFTVLVDPSLRSYAGPLALWLKVSADTSLGRSAAPALVLLQRYTQPLPATDIGVPLRSNEVFDLPAEAGGVSAAESDLMAYIGSQGGAPEMDLRVEVELICGGQAVDRASLDFSGQARLRRMANLTALQPGTGTGSARPVDIFTLTPQFQVSTPLLNRQEFNYPPGEAKLTIQVYEVGEGQSPQDALSGIEYASFDIYQDTPLPFAYPPGQPRLWEGKTYVWRARANLRGPERAYVYSNPLWFRVSELLSGKVDAPPPPGLETDPVPYLRHFADDYDRRLLAALRAILGDDYPIVLHTLGRKLPAKGQIRLNGHPYTLEELENLAQEFRRDKHAVTRLRFQ